MRFSPLVERIAGRGAGAWAVHMEARRRRDSGDDIIFLTVGDPDQAPPEAVIEATIAALRQHRTGYAPTAGYPAVRAAIAARVARRTGQPCAADNVVVVPGAQGGLYTALQCLAGPGDEVIVPPYTMSASVTAVVLYGGVPVFADIQEDIFCIDPKSIAARITPRTRGIMVVHIFGHPADMDPIMKIAREHRLWVIEDCAQIPGGEYRGGFVGAIGDLGVFSLNRHKHIQTGEGGLVTTNNSALAERVQLIRNHAESVVGDKGVEDLTNMLGFNFRMTELEAAVGLEQLKKLPSLLDRRIENAEYIAARLGEFEGITAPVVYAGAKHTYYVQPFRFDADVVGVDRNAFVKAMKAELPPFELQVDEGPLVYAGYVRPLYLLPMFQKKIAFGRSHYPFISPYYKGSVDYSKGICPVAERMHFSELFSHEYMRPPATKDDLNDFIDAFEKVYQNRHELMKAPVAASAS